MEELIGRLVAATGIDRRAAELAIGIILTFLQKEGPPDQVRELMSSLPGADAFVESVRDALPSGMFGMGGVMGAGSQMMAAGLSMSDVQSVTREVIAFAREKGGEDKVGAVVGAIPGLSQFI